MKKKTKRILLGLFATLFCTSLVACKAEQVYNEPIEETDLAATYMGETVDADGNLLVPFDVAYAEAFESGAYKYNESQILLKMAKSYNGKRTNDLRKCGIASLEKFSETVNGNWWTAKLNGEFDALIAVKKARSLDEVLMADFDYIYETENTTEEINTASVAETDSTDVSWAHKDVHGNKHLKDQHHLKHCHIQDGWKYMEDNDKPVGGLSSVVIAVIDTGVDYTHPDLKTNMWINTGEIAGNGIDDDGNGYIDDINGVNTITNTGDPMDDHGHGTHVAGIAAAANNNEGVVGVAYNAKIMAIKAGQATGVFNQSDIAEAILYAYQMGADVINMSFGGSACSIVVQDALTTAYTTATLVASAGNDGRPNELIVGAPDPLPSYPAALSYVVGVMSVDDTGRESVFTNYDSKDYNGIEYEVYAPGEQIMSTLPNGRYGKLSGTSMAAPVVSGAAALLRSYYSDRDTYSSKFIAAQICSTSQETAICVDSNIHKEHNLPMILDIYKAFTNIPKPDVNLYESYLFDTKTVATGNTGDGVIDAGETLEIGVVLRNRWGMSENTVVTIDAGSVLGVANPYVEILTPTMNFGSVGTYSTKDNLVHENNVIVGVESGLKIKIADNCPNDYKIVLNVTVTCENGLDEKDMEIYATKGTIEFNVRNGVVLPSQITEDMTLTKDKYYILPDSTYIASTATVTVEAGTKIQFWTDDPDDLYADTYQAWLIVAGEFICEGTENEPVEIFPSEIKWDHCVTISQYGKGYVELSYTSVVNPNINAPTLGVVRNCIFQTNTDEKTEIKGYPSNTGQGCNIYIREASNSVFYKLSSPFGWSFIGSFYNSTFIDCSLDPYYPYFENCVFMGCKRSIGLATIGEKFSLEKTILNEETGVTYLQMHLPNTTYFAYHLIPLVREYAQALGGDLCCIETPEEWGFLKTTALYGNLGLRYGSQKWENGNSVGDFLALPDYNGDDMLINCPMLYKIDSRLEFDASMSVILELPQGVYEDDFVLDQLSINNIITEWRKQGLNNVQFRGNVVLNNFNETDVSSWLSVSTGHYYSEANSIGVAGNYWGTIDEFFINKQISDFDKDKSCMDIVVGEYLTVAPENTFPFVTDAYLLDSNGERVQTVGNETATFVVEFNRDMDTSVPLRVRFGSSYPYAEYEVAGEYVSARRWEGTYTLKTTIENGNQFFNIENGQAADDSWLKLYEHAGRFTFELDTTAAQAMIMQGEATQTGIQLTWMQDDFDTLLGYNVYRSDKEDGYYTRLNDYVLSADENAFFDDTVEPGKIYYYNFTVVKTDLTESIPSGKIVIRSMDTMAPAIYHSPVRTAYTGSNLLISATITDNLQIMGAKLYYRTVGATEWKSVTMSALNSKYTGLVSAENLSVDGLEYYIEAFDGISYTYKGSADDAYVVTVKLAVDANSLGDVDGDGTITVKDAQMLLQAKNDLLNLTEEQFLRADIDGNGELAAVEAMKILDYVSGKITTIV